jgi:hypothetical protein
MSAARSERDGKSRNLLYRPLPESFSQISRSSLYVGGNLTPTLTVAELHTRPPASTYLGDVRSNSEFGAGHIPAAVNIPMPAAL